MKNIRKVLVDDNIAVANEISSFGLESLMWNIPDEKFKTFDDLRLGFYYCLKYLHENTNRFSLFKEANGIKYLCTDDETTAKYQKFINELYEIYELK